MTGRSGIAGSGMAQSKLRSFAIIGGGPAGATLGTLLAREGHRVGIFHTDKRPPLIVGESLLPAVVPMLRRLGIEDQVASFSVYKPGATVCLTADEIITFKFAWADGKLPDYAYNTPRDLFDRAVLGAAEAAGAKIFSFAAKVERSDAANGVRLTSETLASTAAFFGGGPDYIIDASGRSRVISRLLDGPVTHGGRGDVALFAHLSIAEMADKGHIHTDYLTRGWSWRIPLPGRVSLGVVIDPKHLSQYGESIEAQYDGYLADEPSLQRYTRGATRLTPVVKYQNYQLISETMHGPGWAMVGDAAGFIDPIFSTGLYLSMKGGFALFEALQSNSPAAMDDYQAGRHHEFRLWRRVIDSWYNGKLFNLHRAGLAHRDRWYGSLLARRLQKRTVRVFTGQAVDKMGFSLRIIDSMLHFGTLLRDPRDLRIN